MSRRYVAVREIVEGQEQWAIREYYEGRGWTDEPIMSHEGSLRDLTTALSHMLADIAALPYLDLTGETPELVEVVRPSVDLDELMKEGTVSDRAESVMTDRVYFRSQSGKRWHRHDCVEVGRTSSMARWDWAEGKTGAQVAYHLESLRLRDVKPCKRCKPEETP